MPEDVDFSIIVPTRDRPRQLAVCLESLASLDYPQSHYEVIVVDDGSRISPESITSAFRNRIDLILLTQPKAGPAAARNNGATRARGQLLAFTDDDCTPAHEWLQKLAERFKGTGGSLIGGQTINALIGNVYSAASQSIIRYLYEYYGADRGDAHFFASNNMAVPTGPFCYLGGFDEGYPKAAAEDRDFCARWRHAGYGMAYAREAIVYHRHLLGFVTFWRQHIGYGRGAYQYYRKRSVQSGDHFRFEPIRFYTGLLTYPFLKGKSRWPTLEAVLMALSQIGNLSGFFCEWARPSRVRK
jgi:glycosyltransferase involved in cell wall biosynthesis